MGLEKINYALRVDPTYTSVLQNSVRSLLTTIPVVLIFSLFVAVVLNRRLPGRTAFRAIFFLPVIGVHRAYQQAGHEQRRHDGDEQLGGHRHRR